MNPSLLPLTLAALLAAEMAEPAYANKHDPIPRSLNALALLASGDPAYLPLVKKEAQWAADFSAGSFQTWYYGYVMLLLSEYVIATGDVSVMPGLKRLALASARGQSAVGSWGHGFAIPDGRLGGYGMMNSPGVPLTIALALARTAGVKDAAVDRAIERSARLLRFYIGKGAIPYGDHAPWTETHEDNGKCGMTAVLFDLLGEEKGAEFFSRMSVASHGPERDTGHTGNFFNMLWASEHRTPELMQILLSYGAHAKPVTPELKTIADYFEKDEKDFPKKLMLMKAKSVRDTIASIEASTDSPELIQIK